MFNFGENKFQELKQKQEELRDLDIKWHFIGRLQSNKISKLVGTVELIHSVDRMKLWNILREECAEKKYDKTV